MYMTSYLTISKVLAMLRNDVIFTVDTCKKLPYAFQNIMYQDLYRIEIGPSSGSLVFKGKPLHLCAALLAFRGKPLHLCCFACATYFVWFTGCVRWFSLGGSNPDSLSSSPGKLHGNICREIQVRLESQLKCIC